MRTNSWDDLFEWCWFEFQLRDSFVCWWIHDPQMPRDSGLVEKQVCIYLIDLLEGLSKLFLSSACSLIKWIILNHAPLRLRHPMVCPEVTIDSLLYRFASRATPWGTLLCDFFIDGPRGFSMRKFVVDMCDEISGNSIVILGWSYSIRLVVMDFWLYSTGEEKSQFSLCFFLFI